MLAALFAAFHRRLLLEGAMAAQGLISSKSSFGAKETMDRLEAALRANGVTIFARIDHAAGAAAVGEALRPTEVLIFGNPKAGTPLMQAEQTIGIDLPLKALVWRDAAGEAWLSYNEPGWIAQRHGLGAATAAPVANLAALLKTLAAKATAAA
jgi:uncharacterized protein (DUF302 family)